jgi:trehalose-6-phosphate synthase
MVQTSFSKRECPEAHCRAGIKFEGIKLIVGVGHLHHIKGTPQKPHASEIFLSANVPTHSGLALQSGLARPLVAVPSR